MKKDTIVQFVCFESKAPTEEFIAQWEQYSNQVSNYQDVILQQELETKNISKYVSQHRSTSNDFQFIFKKGKRLANSTEVEIRIKEAGGYMPVQIEYTGEADTNQTKAFVFITASNFDPADLKNLTGYKYLNIYQAYYESCIYSYILEFFIENSNTQQITDQLLACNIDSRILFYKECLVMAK